MESFIYTPRPRLSGRQPPRATKRALRFTDQSYAATAR